MSTRADIVDDGLIAEKRRIEEDKAQNRREREELDRLAENVRKREEECDNREAAGSKQTSIEREDIQKSKANLEERLTALEQREQLIERTEFEFKIAEARAPGASAVINLTPIDYSEQALKEKLALMHATPKGGKLSYQVARALEKDTTATVNSPLVPPAPPSTSLSAPPVTTLFAKGQNQEIPSNPSLQSPEEQPDRANIDQPQTRGGLNRSAKK